jgi:4-diphosphocytidyl-2-C-methyl-D-erythritol kinase
VPKIQIKAPAKINLHLHIGDRRPDGFHGIESLFLALDFGDTLHFETLSSKTPPEICMDWQLPHAPKIALENNTVFRAISLFKNRTGYDEGLKVSVTKRIPPGSGLGGGSSDAASALLTLNRLAGAASGKDPVSGAVLAEMGAELGSDVPFFLNSAPAAWVSGRGEHVFPFKAPETLHKLFFVLVYPGFPSDTAAAYRLFDSLRGREDRHCLLMNSTQCSYGHGSSWESALNSPPRDWPFSNDFMAVFKEAAVEYPAYRKKYNSYWEIITSLRELGAEFSGLSGSGSSCFGVFSDQLKAESAKTILLEKWNFVIFSFSLVNREI